VFNVTKLARVKSSVIKYTLQTLTKAQDHPYNNGTTTEWDSGVLSRPLWWHGAQKSARRHGTSAMRASHGTKDLVIKYLWFIFLCTVLTLNELHSSLQLSTLQRL